MIKSILVTGCSDDGLGAALAIAFKNAKYRVIASARNENKLAQVRAAGCDTITLDVTSRSSIDDCVREVRGRLDGKLDILLNNAGVGGGLAATDLDITEMRNTFEVNTFSILAMSQAFLPLLRVSTEGWIVNNTSVAAVIPMPMQGAYNASKAAASMLTQTLRLELRPFGIKVIELRTAAVKSRVFENLPRSKRSVPPDSIYGPIAKDIEHVIGGANVIEVSQPASEWAQQIVTDLEDGPPLVIYRGGNAQLAESMYPLSTLLDELLYKSAALDKLEQHVQQQSSKDD